MKVAIIGSRSLRVDENIIGYFLPDVPITEIVSGGAKGIDTCAKTYALAQGIPFKEFLPDYPHYGKAAPLKRNEQIVQYADHVVAFWDCQSRGTKQVIELCRKNGKEITVYEYGNAPDAEESWEDFVKKYGPLVFAPTLLTHDGDRTANPPQKKKHEDQK